MATDDEMVGWHHWLNGHESEQIPWDSRGQGAWHAAVHWVTKSRTGLREWTTKNSQNAEKLLIFFRGSEIRKEAIKKTRGSTNSKRPCMIPGMGNMDGGLSHNEDLGNALRHAEAAPRQIQGHLLLSCRNALLSDWLCCNNVLLLDWLCWSWPAGKFTFRQKLWALIWYIIHSVWIFSSQYHVNRREPLPKQDSPEAAFRDLSPSPAEGQKDVFPWVGHG